MAMIRSLGCSLHFALVFQVDVLISWLYSLIAKSEFAKLWTLYYHLSRLFYYFIMVGQNGLANGGGSSLAQVEQVVKASLRSLPAETGDGTYVKYNTTTGLGQDLSHVDLKDVKTLAEVAKSAITGDPVNDREYIMERVIQVRHVLYILRYPSSNISPARSRFAFYI